MTLQSCRRLPRPLKLIEPPSEWITKSPLRGGPHDHEVDHETAVGWITVRVALKLSGTVRK